jgi:hypothetical protein
MQNRMENQADTAGIAGFGYSLRLVRRRLIGSVVRPRSGLHHDVIQRQTGLMALIHGGVGGFNKLRLVKSAVLNKGPTGDCPLTFA